MYTLQQAKEKVQEFVTFCNQIYNDTFLEIKTNIVIHDDLTQNHEFGWVFFYQSQNEDTIIGGNGPIIVEKDTLNMYQMMTAYTIDENLELFLEDKNKLGLLAKDNNGIWDTQNL